MTTTDGRARGRHHSARGLTTSCRALRASLRKYDVATDDEIAYVWPRGEGNPYQGYDAWIECYAELKSLTRRVERQASRDTTRDDELERAVRASASKQPVALALSIGTQCVYPKSAWSLWFLDSLDAVSLALFEQAATIVADHPDLRGFPSIAQGLAYRTWAWVLLHPGVGLPFDDAGLIAPPEWTTHLITEDHVAIYLAHKQLHYDASAIMGSAFPREDKERSRLSLSGFLAGYGSEHGIRPSELFRRWSLPEALAAAIASSESYRVAKANAERETANR